MQHSRLDSVCKKLVKLHATKKGKLNIIHIGDSHLQADGITSVVRNGFHDFFGNAGRGLVFPYQLANTNAPKDVHASSGNSWRNARVTNADPMVSVGLCGYGIECGQKNAYVRVSVRDENGVPEYFNRMVFFLGKDKADYLLTDSSKPDPVTFTTKQNVDTPSFVYEADSLISGFELAKTEATGNFSFYGVSLERKDAAGVLYHTIGVNGARYDQYTNNSLFWEQLKPLRGDLFILSLGTNEAQNQGLSEQSLLTVCEAFAQRIHKIAPKAVILITTPPGSYYKGKKPNASLQTVARTFTRFAMENGAAYWDLYKISGGKTSAAGWNHAGLLSGDLVHYNQQGYHLQGQLLLSAFAKSYNAYARLHPYKPEPVITKVVSKPVPRPKTEKKAAAIVNKPVEPKPAAIPVQQQAPPPPPRNSKIKIKYEEGD